MWLVDDWHDVVRVLCLIGGLVSILILGRRYGRYRNDWNVKTRDLWFAMVLWCIVAIVLPIEGMIEDRPLEPRMVIYTLATFVMVKGLWSREQWGGHD